MKTHYINPIGELTEGTHRYPANSGIYLVIFNDGRTSVEAYSVAFGWNNFPGWDIAISSYLKPLPNGR
jgi:hypothetical protein